MSKAELELREVERQAARLRRAAARVDVQRQGLDDAIRKAGAAGATLRPIAKASGLSIEWVRQILARAA